MAIQQFTESVEIIQGLLDHPNLEGGMTAEELKKKFDAAAVAIKTYINDVLVPEVNRVGGTDTALAMQIKSILDDVEALQQNQQVYSGNFAALVQAYDGLATKVSNVENSLAALIQDDSVSPDSTWSSEKIKAAFDNMSDGGNASDGGVGCATPEGGVIFNDYENNEAAAKHAAAFGTETKAMGEASFATGTKKTRSGAPGDPADSDWRHCEAIGTGSMAAGMGAVAYSRASKSLGYRTQAGFPPSAEHAAARPEAEVQKDASGNTTYPADSTGVAQAAVAIGADTAAVGKHSLAGGLKSKARGDNSLAFGGSSEANGNMAIAMGNSAKATGVVAIAIGNQVEASGDCAFAGGVTTRAFGDYSTAFGHSTQAVGDHSFVAGSNNAVEGIAAAGFGAANFAGKDAAFVAGYNNQTDGHYTFVAGNQNLTDSTKDTHCAAVFGKGNTANRFAQFICGAYSKATETDVFAVGVGVWGGQGNEAATVYQNGFAVDTSGNATAYGNIASSTGADYAEFFEWEDNNPDAEDRVGLLVTPAGEKIRLAQAGDDVLGIISGTAAVLGDSAAFCWKNKYLTDEYGRTLYDMVEEFVEVLDRETMKKKQESAGFFPHPRLNPDYDPEETYVPRENRPEWDKVGLMGKLYTRDDGTCTAGGYGCVGADGVLTHSDMPTNIRIMKRTRENIVLVLMK